MGNHAMAIDNKPHLKIVKPSTEAQKATRTTLDTILVTPSLARSWKLPAFQRPLRVNDKVNELAREIAETEIIPGTLTIGVIDKVQYIVDGQHRREAFLLAVEMIGTIREAFADVRYAHFDDMAEMGDEFVKLNSHLVTMKPDDILRGLEQSHKGLAMVRRQCPFVGYDNVRRNDRAAVVSMSAFIRCWFGSATEVPAAAGMSAKKVVEGLTEEEAEQLITFGKIAFGAWGKEPENYRLWSNLNLIICMWLYRRLVITAYSPNTKKITREMFGKCLMSLAADPQYNDWLLGRQLRERDRAPAYQRVKSAFAKRIETEEGTKPRLPGPDWGGR